MFGITAFTLTDRRKAALLEPGASDRAMLVKASSRQHTIVEYCRGVLASTACFSKDPKFLHQVDGLS